MRVQRTRTQQLRAPLTTTLGHPLGATFHIPSE